MDRYGKISVWSRYSAQILFYNHPQIPGFMQLCSAVGRLDLLGGGGGESPAPKPQAARGVPPKVFEIRGLWYTIFSLPRAFISSTF